MKLGQGKVFTHAAFRINQLLIMLAMQALDLSKYPDDIYPLIVREVNDKFQLRAIKIPTKREVYSIIRYARGLFAPVDNFESTMKAPFAQTQDGMVFFQKMISGRFNGDFPRIILLASDEGLSILRQQGQVYIDGTFRIVPATFSQCVVIMEFDASSNLTIPCVWCLTIGKNEHIYCEILQNIFILLNYDWMPRICVIDFEMALLKAVKYQFAEKNLYRM
ncbi:hypothetical protein HZS_2604 [Henneguya salminicola]|nr:hypothetical protein HZS_2604 [Henneguya salminicola]